MLYFTTNWTPNVGNPNLEPQIRAISRIIQSDIVKIAYNANLYSENFVINTIRVLI